MEQYGFGTIVFSIMIKKKLKITNCDESWTILLQKKKKVVKIKTQYGNQTKQKLK